MAPQIGFPGLAPRSRAHLCFTMVEGSNRRREEGDVSRGFRVPRATDWQGPIGFFVASPFPTWRRTHFPSTLNSCRSSSRAFSAFHCQPLFEPQWESGSPTPSFSSQRESRALVVCNEGCAEGKAQGAMPPSTRRIFVAMTVSAHDQGSGFPLRRE